MYACSSSVGRNSYKCVHTRLFMSDRTGEKERKCMRAISSLVVGISRVSFCHQPLQQGRVGGIGVVFFASQARILNVRVVSQIAIWPR